MATIADETSKPVEVVLWDPRGAVRVTTLDAFDSGIRGSWACAFSRDGRRIAATSRDAIRLWDAATGVELWRTVVHGVVVGLRFSVDNRRILLRTTSRLEERSLLIVDAETGVRVGDILGHACGIHAFDLSPDGRMIATAAYVEEFAITTDPTIKLWRLESGERPQALAGHRKKITDRFSGKTDHRFIGCRYTADGRLLLSASDDRTIRVWNTEIGEELTCFHSDVSLSALGVGRAGEMVAVGNEIGELSFLRLEAFHAITPIVTAVRSYDFDRSDWDAEPTTTCPRCGRRFTVPAIALDAFRRIAKIVGLSVGDSPCAELPSEAWDEPRLLSVCAHCRQPLRFNPFVIDDRDCY
jgi:hypothetical protein